MLLHGLTATRRYVVMGSRTLERSGHRVVAYDARGHGRSSPAPSPSDYGYDELAGDLLAVLDGLEIDRAVLAGASMGGHTLLALALDAPERVAGAVVITPGYDPETFDAPDRLAHWDALADGLRSGGIDGFLAAYDIDAVPEAYRDTVVKVIRQRLALHEHPEALADALQVVPRSRPFGGLDDLARAVGVAGRGRRERRPPRPRAPAGARRGVRGRHPRRPARARRARPLADRLAGEPALERDRLRRRRGSLVSAPGRLFGHPAAAEARHQAGGARGLRGGP